MFSKAGFTVALAACIYISSSTINATVTTIMSEEGLATAAGKSRILAVEFFAPWCSHCKKLAPEWTKAAEIISASYNSSAVTLAQIDATTESTKQLNSKYNIRGFPTILMFYHGDLMRPEQYNGPRTADGIASYILRRLYPAAVHLNSHEASLQFLNNATEMRAAVVAFTPHEDEAALAAFHAMSGQLLDDVNCAYVTERSHLRPCSSQDCDSPIAILQKQEGGRTWDAHYEGKFTVELLTNWASSHASPLVARYIDEDREAMAAFHRSWKVKLPRVFVLFDKEKDITNEALDAVKEAATANDDLKFFVASLRGSKKLLDYVGIPRGNGIKPMLFVVQTPENNTKYLKGSMKLDLLPEFIEEYKVGALEPFVKSEDPHVGNAAEGPITVVTARTYKDIVQDSGKNVFLELYAPWCGHCKKLAKPWEALGKAYKDNPNVIIAKMDATKNDIPDSRVSLPGYPTLVWFPSQKARAPVYYPGGRSLEELQHFVQQQLVSVEKEKEESSPNAAAGGGAEMKEHDGTNDRDEL